ncbi:programmed cell death protein 2 [Jackrogersella minutella]|nr:programmed cell death protein 2 [Jackrogersella minutella]
MAPYDSDSSAGEEDEFTETNVLLGYASKDAGDETISRLGGRPEWLVPTDPPSAALARCKICKNLMVLLLQLDGELPDRFPGHERRLYVFSCRRKSCRRRDGSIRALRGVRIAPGSAVVATTKEKNEENVKPAEEKPKSQPPSNLGETLFGAKTIGSPSGSANPFSTTAAPSASGNPFASAGNPFCSPSSPPPAEAKPEPKTDPQAQPTTTTNTEQDLKALPKTFAETLSLNTPPPATPTPEPWPAESEQPTAYPISYLSEADYETLDPTPASVPQNTRMEVDADGKSGGGKEDREVFESSMDLAFQRFADRLAQNPEQAIRYEFGGQPLLYSKTDAVGKLLWPANPGAADTGAATAGGMPRCANCAAPRAFEVQLTPHAIAELEAEELSLDGMDWGTVVVAVCERDCQARGVPEGRVGYLEEWAGVQWEELASAGGGKGGGKR